MASALSRTCTRGRHARFSTGRWRGCGGCVTAARSPPTGRRATARACCCRSRRRSCPAPGAGSRWSSCATTRARAGIEAACEAEGIGLAGWRKVPVDRGRARRRRRSRRCRGSSSSSSSGRSASARTRRRSARTAHAGGPSACAARTSRRSRSARSPTRRSARRTSSTPSTRTCAIRRSRSPSRSSTSASRRTRRRRGSARSRSGSSATTARSTRSAATSRGCARARRGSETSCSRPCSTSPAPTRRCSTTRSSCSPAAAATSGTRCRCSCRRRGRTTRELDPEVRAFHRYHAGLIEPWDGPAGVVFTDGRVVGAALDRNGLRPLRYAITDDGLVACASEAGAIPLPHDARVRRGKLGPGRDARGRRGRARRRARRATSSAGWPRAARTSAGSRSGDASSPRASRCSRPRATFARATSWPATRARTCRSCCRPAASHGHEPISSMGDDTALPPLAGRARPLYSFFRQRFAQVTNPPIDHLRERSVMSLQTLARPACAAARRERRTARSSSSSTASSSTRPHFPCSTRRFSTRRSATRPSSPLAAGCPPMPSRLRATARPACCSTMRRPPRSVFLSPRSSRSPLSIAPWSRPGSAPRRRSSSRATSRGRCTTSRA